jgi:hypothetical protein
MSRVNINSRLLFFKTNTAIVFMDYSNPFLGLTLGEKVRRPTTACMAA